MKLKRWFFVVIAAAMAIVLTGCPTDPPKPEPTVTGIIIGPTNASVARGGTGNFSATVEGNDNPPQYVGWGIVENWGEVNRGTFINSNGVLTVAGNETRETITIRAISTFDMTISETATIAVTTGAHPSPGASLAVQLEWLRNNAQSGGTYTIEINADQTIHGITSHDLAAALPTGRTDLTITLRGIGAMRTVRLAGHGALFVVNYGVTLVLDENITLQGRGNNNITSLVRVNSGGTLIMNERTSITGNGNYYVSYASSSAGGGGVSVSGRFILNGGEISGNGVSRRPPHAGGNVHGGGVGVAN
ncbi:MAG: hypothetical protein FWD88_00990, partial [Treponema sp.]|nr:hypothetical protein [Treponema sp.]